MLSPEATIETLNMSKISIAPMMGYTDRHFRYFLRLITRHSLLYTEMIHTGALLRGNHADRWLAFDAIEHPLALQLGGSDPEALAQCARRAEAYGYDEINLNIGCPSPRVQEGRFGACLMKETAIVGNCVQAMRAAVNIPITVKTRIGVDEYDSYEYLSRFIQSIAEQGCELFILHARKAWLKGLSPKENRTLPPLQYDKVYQLKKDFPKLKIVLNGGLYNTSQIQEALSQLDGVMVGRAACNHPYFLSEVDRLFYQDNKTPLSREEVNEQYQSYIKKMLEQGVPSSVLIRPLFNLYHGQAGATHWRRNLKIPIKHPLSTN
jgi:tRNA-dihydrouridine synthase A